MENYDAFLKTVDPDQLSEIAGKAAASQNDAFAGASQASTSVTLALLRQYHEWLMQELHEHR